MSSTRFTTQWGIARRWTKELAKDGFTPVADVFLDYYCQMNITTSEAMFIIQLMKYKWNEKNPYPSFGAIAKKMGVTDTAARNYARNLEKKGLLQRHQRIGDTNEFDLNSLFVKLEQVRKRRSSKSSEGLEPLLSTPQDIWNALPDNVKKNIEDEVVANLSPLFRKQWERGGARPFVRAECLKRVEETSHGDSDTSNSHSQ